MSDKRAIVILAGGLAQRLPGKLELDAGGVPLIVRVYRNLRDAGHVYVSASRSFPPEIDRALECPVVIDRWPGCGPLAGLYSAFDYVAEKKVFVVAADAPFVTTTVVLELERHWTRDIEAVVALNGQDRLEPLCALYDRTKFLQAAWPVLIGGSGSVAAVVERLQAERVRLLDERVFANVNTPADRRAFLE
jgi:molybdopterin-guanine dinucleotide biosynthesis protein A